MVQVCCGSHKCAHGDSQERDVATSLNASQKCPNPGSNGSPKCAVLIFVKVYAINRSDSLRQTFWLLLVNRVDSHRGFHRIGNEAFVMSAFVHIHHIRRRRLSVARPMNGWS